jgi:hypothetical protein
MNKLLLMPQDGLAAPRKIRVCHPTSKDKVSYAWHWMLTMRLGVLPRTKSEFFSLN